MGRMRRLRACRCCVSVERRRGGGGGGREGEPQKASTGRFLKGIEAILTCSSEMRTAVLLRMSCTMSGECLSGRRVAIWEVEREGTSQTFEAVTMTEPRLPKVSLIDLMRCSASERNDALRQGRGHCKPGQEHGPSQYHDDHE